MTEQWIDPEIAEVLAATALPFEVLGDHNVGAVRRAQLEAAALLQPSAAVARTDHTVPGPAGGPDVVLRVHRPVDLDGPAPCLYWVHGGGYVIGSYRTEDLRLERLCLDLGCVAVAVDYRLAPETPYPGPMEDCYAGLAWVAAQAPALGVDPGRLGVGGGSAGAGLAAALSLAARDRGGPALAFQLLVYPMLDDRGATRSSGWAAPVWSPANNRYGWQAYLGDCYGTDHVPATAAPARADDLAGLPPAFVGVGSADLFVDEDVAYAHRLLHAGVPTELHVYAGAVHGFETITPAAALAVRLRRDVTEWLGRVMGAGVTGAGE
ncbi:MAG TPA: alpha/beta hydrolase [Acidimicrobiales bacterium]|nr:alpha/beta hydrolase [Acidimicrobiales bacterium]